MAAGRALDVVLALMMAGIAFLIVRAAITDPGFADRTPDAARLARDPLDLPALRNLGLRLDTQGRLGEADSILGFVGRRTRRDRPTEVWLLRRRLNQGRYREALERADSLLRQDADGTSRPFLFPLLVAATAEPGARPALEAALAAAPWWRGDFLRALGTGGDIEAARQVFFALERSSRPPSAEEYAPFIDRLAAAGDYRGARTAWSHMADSGGRAPRILRDGDFRGTPDRTPFTWSPAAGAGAASETVAAPGGSAARALRVDYDSFSSPALPAQLLVDPPHRYRLGWRERIDPPGPERLYWRVRCADTDQVLARSPPPAPGWRAPAMVVESPRSGCAAQWLELTAEPGERRAAVTAWYQAFRLQPLP